MRLRDGSEVEDPRLGRLVQFDPASRNFPVRAALDRTQLTEMTRLWYLHSTARVLDQGRDGACVGFGVTNELRYTPRPVPRLDATFAKERIYWEAQRIDDWEGGSYPGGSPTYEGTSVLAGVKVAQRLGFYSSYRWCFGEPDLALAVSHLGPVIIGVPWYEGMFRTDAKNYIRPTGKVVGGHCVLVVGLSVARDDFSIMNSWGPTFGDRGRARITRADMARLLREDGEACVVERTALKVAAP